MDDHQLEAARLHVGILKCLDVIFDSDPIDKAALLRRLETLGLKYMTDKWIMQYEKRKQIKADCLDMAHKIIEAVKDV